MEVNTFLKFLVFYCLVFASKKTKNFKKVFTLNLQKRNYSAKQDEYQQYLQSMAKGKHTEVLARNTHKGLPCGNNEFIMKLSGKIGRDLSFKNVGRPKKG
jgi:hypothetical protein